MSKGEEDIYFLFDRNCEITSDPYLKYESQDTGIYVVLYFRNLSFFVQCRTELGAFKGRGLQGRFVQN